MSNIVIVIASISGSNTGLGGHYYDSMVIAEELSKFNLVNIVNLGDFPANALSQSQTPVKYVNIQVNTPNINRNSLKKCLENYNPDVIIAFDRMAGLIVRPLCVELGCGFVLVKPGGGKLSGYYPNNPFQIYFSYKDIHWALNRRKDGYGKVCCIPNRVQIPQQDHQAIAKLKHDLSILPNDLVLIRISRIVQGYKPSFLKAIRLVNFLRDQGYPARLVIIGFPQCESTFQEIKSQLNERDAIVTLKEFTLNASRLLKIAKINIGIGRGFMEGCAISQHMMAINTEDDLPTVVTEDNFNYFFQENFSMRVTFQGNEKINQERIISLAELSMKEVVNSKVSQKWFREKFSSEQVCSLYDEILHLARVLPERWSLDMLYGEFYLKKNGLQRFVKKLIKY
ncbi:hypothetical protein [Geminocystis sp. GBBB08]|uniref:hypothetical protein n=1 Tax=Geminocystis sp. GBBB08 TaxID=2604140 RepID=UPI0027E2EAE3|nr:hypothetical protein [Geminocystis sp. GBBB08]MBL1210148.1 glycosyltransferase [Geminocystis sp. GBBB08]